MRRTPPFSNRCAAARSRLDEDIDARFFHLADDYLTSEGFDHYETSNYAKPGMHSSHNQGYWRGEDYLGPRSVRRFHAGIACD